MGVFNNKTDNSNKNGIPSSHQTNLFSEGTVIEGQINTTSDIRLDGSINGNIHSTSKIVIGQKGRVEGELKCQNADISGYIRGRVEATDMLFLKATADIEGDIVANKLVVEAGARFNGACRMNSYSIQNEQPEITLRKEAI